MHTLIICREYGFDIVHGNFDIIHDRFNRECSNQTITTMVWYDIQGLQINAYAKPGTFKF